MLAMISGNRYCALQREATDGEPELVACRLEAEKDTIG
jgi:hypothetical protein